jgi:DsbC/DsbD-like thiol-disulfide interchange protein
MTVIVPVRAALGFAATVFASFLTIEARAQDASPWQRDGHSAVRLLAGSRSGAVLLGGIAFQLQAGWKTYWRTPGDSGVPPRFDFSKSDNIEAVTVLWPAPLKFDDGAGGHSMGYHDQIVLPLRIVPKNADKPVTLRADISYAVCEKICIPVQANAELPFTSVASTEDSALFAALDTVPKPANVGDPNPLTIRDVKRGQIHRPGRCGQFRCRGSQPVRRRTDAGMGTAGSKTARTGPARRQTLRLRTRRRAARQQPRWRRAEIDAGRP